jgi:hypothetical protein
MMLKIAASFVLLISLTSVVVSQSKTGTGKWLKGTWEGTGYQTDNNETWTMKLTVRGNRYEIEYPSLNCGGKWIPLSISRSRARFIEKITLGIETCTDNGNVVIERLSRRQIAYRYANRRTRQVTASAILNRKK